MRECVAGETGDATAPGFSGDGVGYVVATTSGPLAQGDGAGAGDRISSKNRIVFWDLVTSYLHRGWNRGYVPYV